MFISSSAQAAQAENDPVTSEESTSVGGLDLNDLGTVPSPTSLSDEQKYQVLSNIPSKLKEYPLNQQKWHFHPYWTDQFPWVQYSKALDGVFCASCFLFSRVHFNNECLFTIP